jgi:ATP-dependent RNA helicase DeaD
MGFRDDIEHVLKFTPNRQSTWLFSATMPPEVRQVSKRYMESPAEITIGKVNAGNANIDHQFYMTSHHNRYETLKRLVDFNPGIYGIIFTRTKADAQGITEALIREGYDIEALHGDLTQQQRDKVMARFREKSIQLLIATDVAARGIDIKEISHVINYELPDDIEVYTHRSGRTGRAGHNGISISLVTPKESFRIKLIERLINTKFHRMDIPSGKDVCRKQFFSFIDKMMSTDISHGEYETYIPILAEKFADVSKEEILQRVAGMEFNRFLQYYENASDLNVRENDRRPAEPRGARGANPRADSVGVRGSREGGRARIEYTDTKGRDFGRNNGGNYQRIFVNLGTKDGFYKASFLQFILDMSDLKKDNLGKIDMKDMNSWIEVDPAHGNQMIKAIDGKMYKGRKIRMNDAQTGGNRD